MWVLNFPGQLKFSKSWVSAQNMQRQVLEPLNLIQGTWAHHETRPLPELLGTGLAWLLRSQSHGR